MKNLAFLVDDTGVLSAEEESAFAFASRLTSYRARQVSFESIFQSPEVLRRFELMWWHRSASPETSALARHVAVRQAILERVSQGRGLLLSLAAATYPFDLGIETVMPNVSVHGPWDEPSWAESYPDIRGFGAFGPHPIFRGFDGGLYTWVPKIGEDHTAVYYEGTMPAAGAVVAVEKLYIKLNEQRRTIVEYVQGSGRILTIGSHFYFINPEQRFRQHLIQFALNCFDHLTFKSNRSPEPPSRHVYWSFPSPGAVEFPHASEPVSIEHTKLPTLTDDTAIRRDFAAPGLTEQFFDLSGRRILLMGGERGGITEAWCHPVRTLENLKTQFKVGSNQARWSHELAPTVTVRPECLVRRYELDDAVIEETLFADHALPAGGIQFHVKSPHPVQVLVTGRIDLRLMWPLSELATGSLRFSWDEGLRAAIVTDSAKRLSSVVGTSVKPDDHVIGPYTDIVDEAGRLVGTMSDRSETMFGMRISVASGNKYCTIAFAGSSEGLREAILSYRRVIRNPSAVLRKQVRHFRSLQSSTVAFDTPDEQLNRSYRWALAGIDKLFVETPAIGRSFVAGYGLSSEGWNGGHAVSGRPGYAWYFGRDSVWTSFAALDAGMHGHVRDVLEFLGNHQDVTGKILHELTTSGHAHFDAADSTPLYLILMGRYVRASGDKSFAEREFQRVLDAVEFCFSTDTDHDHLIENTNVGHGWVEGGQLFPSHVEQYLASCWAEALRQAGWLARTLGKKRLAARWQQESDLVQAVVNKDFWNPRTGVYNFSLQSDGSYREEPTVLPAVGMIFHHDAAHDVHRGLTEYASDSFSTDWGVRIVSGKSPMFKPTGYHYGSIWPLFTGWTSLAEFEQKRPIQGMTHLYSNALLYDQFSAGNTEEVLHGELFQPAGVCPHQAWSQAMVVHPLLGGMLGLKVDAIRNTVHLSPYFPPQWMKTNVRRIRVGESQFDVTMKRTRGETEFRFKSRFPQSKGSPKSLALTFSPYFPLGTTIQCILTGDLLSRRELFIRNFEDLPVIEAELRHTLVIRIRHRGGLAIVPPIPHPRIGRPTDGIRVLDERWHEDTYCVLLEGPVGEDQIVEIFDSFQSATSVEGARVMAHDGNHLILAVSFAGAEPNGVFARKEIVVHV